MRVFYAGHFTIELPSGHRFPIDKYRRLYAALVADADPDLQFVEAPAVSRDLLSTVHSRAYVDKVFAGGLSGAELRVLGLPWSPALVERSQRSVGATLAAMAAALEDGVGVSLAGGTHHAAYDRGAGFCVFNDVATASISALRERPGTRVLIVDCDVHQGDGSATMLDRYADVFTFSMHGERNYPRNKAISDLDIGLPDQTGDDDYLRELDGGLTRAVAVSKPDIAIVVAGADVYSEDRLGRLSLSMEGIAERDRRIFSAIEDSGAALVVVMGGGYAKQIEDIVAIHRRTVLLAAASWRKRAGVRAESLTRENYPARS